MKILTYIIALIAFTATAQAQNLNPDSLLGNDAPQEQAPEQQPAPQQPPQGMPQVFDYPLTLKCMGMGDMRGLLEQGMQQLPIAFGFNAKAQMQNNPFDGVVITQNAITGEFTIALLSRGNNAGCVIATGTELNLTSTQQESE